MRQLKIAEKQKSKATHVAAAVASRSPAVVTAKTAYKTGKATTSVLPKLIGLGMAGTGLAHFVVPQAFESVHGHEKVPTGGQVEVPAGGQIKVPTLCSSCR
ncbi:hypothetical protein QEN42_22010, partial [Gordonia alkanivorans]|nr:hypothetical protein [Gordonia alkanivorans]